MTSLRLIADDLTGALDTAAQLTGAFGALPVVLNLALEPPSGSFVLDLACRDQTEAAAVALTSTTAHHLASGDIAFKKIDSLLRGHWAAELAVLAKTGSFRRIILAPAFPGQGRITRGGRQIVLGPQGNPTLVPVDPRAEMARHGLDAAVLSRGEVGAIDAALLLCDADSDRDLRSLVQSARALPGPTLWCGAAGLALALSDGTPPRSAAPIAGPHLMMIGSDHPVTRDQVLFVTRYAPDWIVRFDGNGPASADRVNQALARHGRCLCLADLPPGCARAEASELIARWFGAMTPGIAQPRTLSVVGGETFASLCRELQADMLLVEGEWQAGVPCSRSAQGLWTDMACFSKSGAFGEPDCLLRLLGQN